VRTEFDQVENCRIVQLVSGFHNPSLGRRLAQLLLSFDLQAEKIIVCIDSPLTEGLYSLA